MSQLQNFIRRTRLVFVRSSRLTKILILSAMVFSLVALAILRTAIGMGSNHLDSLRHQAAQLEQENSQLEQDIDSLGSLDSLQQIVKDELGLVDPDTVVLQPEN